MTVDTEWIVDFFRGQARLGFEEGDYTRTRNSCQRVLQFFPDDVEAWSLLGEAALASSDTAIAVRSFEHLSDLQPQSIDHALKLGKAYLQLQAWDAAKSAFLLVLSLEHENVEAAQLILLVEQLQERLNLLDQNQIAPSRNDPCPCGSGLKYKKCCLIKNTQHAIKERLAQTMAREEWQHALSLLEQLSELGSQERRQEALAHYYLTQRKQAYGLLQKVVEEYPQDLEVLSAYADLQLDYDPALTESIANDVLARDPSRWRAALSLAASYARRDLPLETERVLREVVARDPGCDMAWERLSNLLRRLNRKDDDLAAMARWVELCPGSTVAWCHLGVSAILAGRPIAECQSALQTALQLKSDNHEALCWLGECAMRADQPNQAQELLLRALQLKPDYQAGWNLLGGIYHKVGRQKEAEGCFMRALAISPDKPYAWHNLACTYRDALEMNEAEQVIKVALDLNPDEPNLWNTYGTILNEKRQIKDAHKAYLKALEVDPEYRPVLVNLAGIEANFGDFDRAIELLDDVMDSPVARSNAMFFVNYHPDWSSEQIFAFYRDVVAQYFPQRKYFSYENELTSERKLRIGYVSPDFRNHVCAHFLEPLLANHDHSQVEVYAYSLAKHEDSVTARFKEYADVWRRCVGLSDQIIAEQIRADKIDILLDTAGHTGNNGLPIFALKPAPVQVSWWMGFAYGTGIKAVDYFLADHEMLPEGCEPYFAERPWRMSGISVAYKPVDVMGKTSELPALNNGFITFGSLTRPVRLNHRVIRVWAELLRRLPTARLVIDSRAFKEPELAEHYKQKFAAYGIGEERLQLGYSSPVADVYRRLDIALDCFPHNSGTTLYESLWMGLPFVTLRDRPSMGRVGSVILTGLDRPEWIADTEQEYIDKLVALASDVEKLANIRRNLRAEMQGSSLCDGVDFAKRMEQTYRLMWQQYCEQGEQP